MHINICTIFRRVFPILHWLPQYEAEKGISDLVAGITVGLTLIPQSIAYAALAGLSPEYGLYSSLCGGIVYTFFGTIPELNIAPTALLSLLTYTYTHNSSYGAPEAAILLCFLSGVIELACGILHLGFLVDFVSIPVVGGFTSAGAITIASAQVKNLLGLKFSAESMIDVWTNVVEHISETKIWDAVLSLVCCITLLALRQLKSFGTPPLSGSKGSAIKQNRTVVKKVIWFISVSRNATVVISTAFMAYILSVNDIHPFSLTNKVPAGLPDVALPSFSVSNGSNTYDFIDMSTELGVGIVVMPFIAILANLAIAKAFAQGKVVDASQEMVAVGLCSIVGSCFRSMPVNAAFSRAAVSNASGTKTPIGGIYTGIMVLLALTFLTPYFSFIPKATLASVIICAVIYMVEVAVIKPMWNINKIDMIPLFGTFFACLLIGIEIGILVGVAVDLLFLLAYNARPKVKVEKCQSGEYTEYLKITPTSAILFPSAEYIREVAMNANVELGEKIKLLVIDCSGISKADYTAAKCVAALSNDLQKNGKSLVFLNLKPGLAKILTGACSSNCIVVPTEDNLRTILKGEEEAAAKLQCNNINSNNNKTLVGEATTPL